MPCWVSWYALWLPPSCSDYKGSSRPWLLVAAIAHLCRSKSSVILLCACHACLQPLWFTWFLVLYSQVFLGKILLIKFSCCLWQSACIAFHSISFHIVYVSFSTYAILCYKILCYFYFSLLGLRSVVISTSVSCSSKSRLVLTFLVLPFWYLLTRVDPDIFQTSSKMVVCVCVCVCLSVFFAACVCTAHITRKPCHRASPNFLCMLPVAQLMPLPLTVSCCSKFRLVLPSSFFLSGAGSPE